MKDKTMNVDELSPQQLRELADQKEQEAAGEVIKTGYLKHDLYTFESDHAGVYYVDHSIDESFDINVMEDICDKFKSYFKNVLKKGTKFVAYKEENMLLWFDDAGDGLEEMPQEWADQNLENIQDA